MIITNSNTATVTGRLIGQIVEDHVILGETFYNTQMEVPRLSGTKDTLHLTIPGRLLKTLNPAILAGPITVSGQVRSYNKVYDGQGHLVVTLFANSITPSAGDSTQNSIRLDGAICKPTTYRITPFGREICDIMLAVNRSFGKSDYIPCIVWGRNAKWASGMEVGDHISVSGRLQSRQYEKLTDDGEYITRTAYELSIYSIERLENEGRAGA